MYKQTKPPRPPLNHARTYLGVHPVLQHVEEDLDVALGLHEPAHVGEGGEEVARGREGREAGDDGVVGPDTGEDPGGGKG